ncbi:MAG: hypothetical protein LBQ84_03975, partial [Flavobacteriaceae bacterium]|nr:hypothetical protein [Flavobacteriaceae bacterium]
LPHFNYETKEYDKYFDNCRDFKYWQYPVAEIRIAPNENSSQDVLSFLRTDEGYMLIDSTFK